MRFEAIAELLDGIPYLGAEEGRVLYDFIGRYKPGRILELGHAHGVSTLYMAAALDAAGAGVIDTVDLEGAAARAPNLESLLDKAGLGRRVQIRREKNSYTWFLKKQIEEQTQGGTCRPCYDFCFIDGPKSWTIDGLTFFLADKLLKDGGWILFDDFNWTHAKHPGREQTDGITVRALSEDQIREPHIEAVFRLLVTQHGGYSNFLIQDDWWAWAQKLADGSREIRRARKADGGP